MIETDILVSGGGVAGLAAAAVFGAAGFRVLIVDPAPPVTSAAAPGADLRTTALLQPARRLLHRAGLWDRLAADAAPLQIMRIAEAGADGTIARQRDFRAADISDEPFGWNLPNWLLRREMVARLADLPGVDFRPGLGSRDVLTRDGEARVTLTDGARVSVRLLVVAEGRDSPLRRALGIGVATTRYGQTALSFAVTHPLPHQGVSTEIHQTGGPFTLVPLPDRDGLPASAVVWMERAAEAARLQALDAAAFSAAASQRSCHILGPLTLASPRQAWPMLTQLAQALTAERTALIAEAAHVVPPIGAQGLNMSLADIATLLDLAEADPAGLGSPAMLDAYARKRRPDLLLRTRGIDLLNRASMAGAPVLRALRAQAMGLLHDISPLRRAVMRLGLGL